MSTPSHGTRSRRGFTLIELMVGSVVTTIILAAVAMTVLAVQNSYQAESRIKVAVESARTATSFIEPRLRMAGYGVDPRIAFDFGTTLLGPSNIKANQELALGKGVPVSVTDDLAFRYRDPAWMRKGTYTSGSLALEGSDTFGTDLLAGQRLIVACPGTNKYLVLLVTDKVLQTLNASSFVSADTALSSMPASDSCLAKTGTLIPIVMLMHEVRLRIMNLDGRPFLMAFPTLENLNIASAVPLAADVESFQVAYVMNRPAPSSALATTKAVDFTSSPANWVLGDVGSADSDRTPNPAATPQPVYDTPYDDAARYNAHPGNIRAVRVSLTVRSTQPEARRRAFERQDVEDSAKGVTKADGYYRTTMTTTVRIPNMLSRSAFIPGLGESFPKGLVWGG